MITGSHPAAEELEKLAPALAAHPDFRVVRRLEVKDFYVQPDDRQLAKGVIIDTETTGLHPDEDKVIELALVAFEFDRATGEVFRILDSYDALEDPGIPIPAQASAVHGILDAMVAGRRIDDSRVAALVEGADVIIAHNAAFDRPFMEIRWPLFATLAWGCSLMQINWREAGLGSHKLEYLAYRCGFFYDAHRAEADCRALLEVLQHPLPDSGQRPLKFLLERYQQQDRRLWARGSRFDSKDLLKERAYRWDGHEKCWHLTLEEGALEAELIWLKAAIYGGKAASLDIDLFDANSRFSQRQAPRVTRII